MPSISYEIKELLESVDSKMDRLSDRMIRLEDNQRYTNGTVRLIQKVLWALGGIMVTIVGWFVSHLLQSID